MTCEDCEKIQNIAFDKSIPDTIGIAYVRIENSNVAVVGCQKHIQVLLDKIRKKGVTPIYGSSRGD